MEENTDDVSVFDMPETTKDEIADKIHALTTRIRNDWSDPRWECREIWRLCNLLKTI